MCIEPRRLEAVHLNGSERRKLRTARFNNTYRTPGGRIARSNIRAPEPQPLRDTDGTYIPTFL